MQRLHRRPGWDAGSADQCASAAVVSVDPTLPSLSLSKTPDKTFVGLISRVGDVQGCHLQGEPIRLSLAAKTIQNFEVKMSRLYEQTANYCAQHKDGRRSRQGCVNTSTASAVGFERE